MKKALRIALFALAAVVLLVAALFLPPITTMIVNSVAASYVDEFHADHVSVGPGGLTMKGVRVAMPGMKGRIGVLEFKGSMLGAAKQNIDAKSVRVTGVELTLLPVTGQAAAKPAAPSEPSKPFEGVVPLSDVGIRIAEIKELEVEAKVELPDGTKAALTVKGGGIGAGKEGSLDVDFSATAPAAIAGLQGLGAHTTGKLRVALAEDSRLASVHWDGTQEAHSAAAPSGATLKIGAEIAKTATGEHYGLRITEPDRDGPDVLAVKADLDATTHRVEGTIDYAADTELGVVRAVMPELPTASAEGHVDLAYDPTANTLAVANKLTARGSRWSRLLSELTPIGALETTSEQKVKVNLASNEIRLDALHLEVRDADAGEAVLTLESQTPFDIDPKGAMGLFPVALKGDSDLRLELHGLPLKWASSFFEGVTYTSDRMTGTFQVTHRDGVVRMATTDPIRVSNFSLSQDKKALVSKINVAVAPDITYDTKSNTVVFAQKEFGVKTSSGEVGGLTGVFKLALDGVGIKHLDVDAHLRVDARAALNQPLLADMKVQLPDDLRTLDGAFKFSLDNAKANTVNVDLETVTLTVGDGAERHSVDIKLLQPTEVKLVDGVARPLKVNGDLIEMAFNDIDYTWVQSMMPGWKLEGEGVKGRFVVQSNQGALRLEVKEPLSAKGFALSGPDGKMIAPVDVEIEPNADLDGGRLGAGLARVVVSSGGEELLSFSGNAAARMDAAGMKDGWRGLPSTHFESKSSAALGAIFKQPALASVAKFKGGTVEWTSEGDVRSGGSARTEVTLKDVALEGGSGKTLDGNVQAEAKLLDGDGVEVSGNAAMTSAGQPAILDADWRGSLKPEGEVSKFGVELNANRVDVVQLMGLMSESVDTPAGKEEPKVADDSKDSGGDKPSTMGAVKGWVGGLFGGKKKEAAAETPAPAPEQKPATVAQTVKAAPAVYSREPDKAPFWAASAAQGKVQVGVREAYLPASLTVSNLSSTMNVEAKYLSLTGTNMTVRDAPTDVDAQLDFTDDRSRPYHLTGRVAMNQFDLGNYIQDAVPMWGKMFRGRVRILGTLDTQAANTDVLVRNIQGNFEMEADHGEVNPLALGGERVRSTVSAALTGGKVLSFLMKKQDTKEKIDTVTKIVDILNGFTFDEFRLKGSRGRDLRVKLDEFIFRSPELEMKGEGYITLTEDMRYMDQPMDVALKFYVKGDTEALFDKVKLVRSASRDELNYAQGPIIRLRGTPEKPDWSDLINILISSVGLQ